MLTFLRKTASSLYSQLCVRSFVSSLSSGENEMLNKTESVPFAFHIIVGKHALVVLIHRRPYFALKALLLRYIDQI